MPTSHVNIKVGADATGAHAVFNNVERRVKGLAGSIGGGLKSAIVGAIGVGTAAELASSMMTFGKSIEDASRRLGLAIDRVQELRLAARAAGKDLGAFDAVFRNVERFGSRALVVGSKEARTANALGLTNEDLQHLNKSDLLNKILGSTKTMDRARAESLLSSVVGLKNASWVLGNREAIMSHKAETGLVSNDDVRKLAELRMQFGNLADTIKIMLIPTFIKMTEALVHFVQDAIGTFRIYGKAKEQYEKELKKKGHGEWYDFFFVDKDAAIKAAFSKPVAKEIDKVEREKKELERRMKEREDEFNKTQADLRGPVNRQAPVTDKLYKSLLEHDMKAQNPYLKIGGLMGIDATYRLERLTEETNNLLRQIVANTSPTDFESGVERYDDWGEAFGGYFGG